MNTYWTYHDGDFEDLSVRDIAQQRKKGESIFSGRLDTGVFGNYDCSVENVGPKSTSEVIVAIGGEGLEKLIQLGFIPCQKCTPLKNYPFTKKLQDYVQWKHGVKDLDEFTRLPIDARRVRHEGICPMIKGAPSRLYLPSDVKPYEKVEEKNKFSIMGFGIPKIGYIDKNFEFQEFT
ncbi:MAG: hypothetical protein ACOCUT_00985 [bacterium]